MICDDCLATEVRQLMLRSVVLYILRIYCRRFADENLFAIKGVWNTDTLSESRVPAENRAESPGTLCRLVSWYVSAILTLFFPPFSLSPLSTPPSSLPNCQPWRRWATGCVKCPDNHRPMINIFFFQWYNIWNCKLKRNSGREEDQYRVWRVSLSWILSCFPRVVAFLFTRNVRHTLCCLLLMP